MREEQIFHQVLEQAADQRAAFLDAACGADVDLRERVEVLLRAQANPGSFLQFPSPEIGISPTLDQSSRERPGTMIGPYKLLQQIGEGGMGVVYMAEQTEPVQRKVALKLIKPGMDSRQIIARFEAERQALAMMDHVNIARVLDAGTTAPIADLRLQNADFKSEISNLQSAISTGRPYFVMELVHGVPITKYCDDNRLTPRQRLELFVPVCQAIQHAHQKGVIHRDIKPSNVMVTLYDGQPVPKVIDFGVAKATEQRLTERTLFTQYGTMVGTLEYMSPEQAEMSALGVDTRSDIYSLGVLLYELLTGSTPLSSKRMKEAAYAEILRLIKEEEPPKPSIRLSESGEALASISAQRHMEPAKLTKLVRGELDWIVMKTLEKDRSRRYETANGLAMDLQHYLADEPVLACPPSAAYRLKKFVCRNKGPVVAAAVVLLTLVGGIVGTTLGLVQAQQAQWAEAQRADGERRAKQEAQEREAETKAVLDFVEKKIFAAARPEGEDEGLGHDVTLRRAIEAALPFVDQDLAGQPLIEARLRLTLGQSFWSLGEAKIAAEQQEKARALYAEHRGLEHRDTLASMHSLANSYADLGRHADALRLNEETLAVRRTNLGPDDHDTLDSMHNLASNYTALRRYADALRLREETLALQKSKLGPHHRSTLASMHNLANIYPVLGRHTDAVRLREETLALQKAKLGPDDRDTLACMLSLANSYSPLGRDTDALKLREEVLALRKAKLGPDHVKTLASMSSLAHSYAGLGRHADALRLREEALELWKAKRGPNNPNTLLSMSNLADSYVRLDRHTDALRLNEETLALRRTNLGPDHRDTLASMHSLASSYSALGRHADALRLREETLALQKAKLGPDHPETLASLIACNRGAEAVPLIDECVRRAQGKRVPPGDLSSLMNLRLSHFEKSKDASGCRESAEMWERLNHTDASSLYKAASYRAVTAAVLRATDGSGEAAPSAAAEADRAMDWLGKAVAAGYSNVSHMKKDRNLDALREREDFKKLLAELPAKFK